MSSAAYAVEDFSAPVPDANDEVTSSGPNTKFTDLSLLRYKAFENALTQVPPTIEEDKKVFKLYVLSDDEKSIRRARVPNARITQYTNDTYSIKYKNEPDTIYSYNKDGELDTIIQIAEKTKTSYYAYHYDADGKLKQIEVKPDRYHIYIYGLDGLLVKYVNYDDFYDASGKFLYKKRHIISL